MSYYAPIHFKTIQEGELYAFLKKTKDTCKEHFDEIAKDNFLYMPSISKDYLLKKASEWTQTELDRTWVRNELDRAWMRNSVFSYRFFYISEHNLLGVFGLPDAVQSIFDLTVYFQNSCDQNYEFETWNGVPLFEEIAKKWKACSLEEVAKHMDREEDVRDMERLEKKYPQYYAKSACYDEIWKMFEKYLYSDSEAIFVSMFGSYEISEQKGFVIKCRKLYEEWLKQFEEKEEEKKDDEV